MKKMFLIIPVFLFAVIFLSACSKKEAYKKELISNSYKVVIVSEEPPHVGINKWKLYIYTKGGSPVTDANVKVNGYMPPMPGMPEMSFDYPVKNTGHFYESDVNLSMGGTWQITITVEREGKKESLKFGFNL
ncbi:FixH family protein [Persephonella sp.]